MTNISKITALVAFFGPCAAAPVFAEDMGDGACPARAWVTVEGEQVALPAEVAENVTMLQSYGARYARAIALTLRENTRPDWTFGEDCPDAGAAVVASDG